MPLFLIMFHDIVYCSSNIWFFILVPLFFVFAFLHLHSFFGPASARSYKIGVVGNGWLVGWLVGNAVFSETTLRIFPIFCMKLGDYKGRKVTEPDF